MVPYTKVINGFRRYINEEIVNKLTNGPRWAVGTVAGIMMTQADKIYTNLKNNTFIKSMSIINDKDEVDIELIYKELKKQATTPMSVNIPLVGTFTLTEQDVDKLYNFIMGG